MDVERKNLFIFGENNNPMTYNCKNYFDSFCLLEFKIIQSNDKSTFIPPKNEIWFLRWQHTYNTETIEFSYKPNLNLGNSVLGAYGHIFDEFLCDNYFYNFSFGKPIRIRDNQIKLEVVDEKGLTINFNEKGLEIYLIIQIYMFIIIINSFKWL